MSARSTACDIMREVSVSECGVASNPGCDLAVYVIPSTSCVDSFHELPFALSDNPSFPPDQGISTGASIRSVSAGRAPGSPSVRSTSLPLQAAAVVHLPFENAAHAVAFEQYEAFHRILVETILPKTYPALGNLPDHACENHLVDRVQ
jgi:hypothetical protein